MLYDLQELCKNGNAEIPCIVLIICCPKEVFVYVLSKTNNKIQFSVFFINIYLSYGNRCCGTYNHFSKSAFMRFDLGHIFLCFYEVTIFAS